MGWKSLLAKVGLGVAAPFTGGASLAFMPAVDAVANAVGSVSQAKAQNRGAEFGGQLDLERAMLARDLGNQRMEIDREQEGRASGQDAWRRLMAAQRTLNPGPSPQLSPYSVAPRMPGQMERAGAEAMTQEVMARLQSGNPISPVQRRGVAVDPKLLKAGTLESILGYAAPALNIWGQLAKARKTPTDMSQVIH